MFKKIIKSKDFRYLLLYGVFGGIAALVDFSVFTGCVKGLHIHNVVSNIISMHAGMLVSFTLNNFLNFKKRDKIFRRFLAYYAIVLIGMGISSLIIAIGSAYMPVLIVKVIAMAVATAIQYLFNRFFTFRF